jgi:hypothetical protein
VVGPTLTLVGSLLSWVRSGEATRSSFALLRSARTLGVLPASVDGLAPLWYLLPVVVGLVWLAAAMSRWRIAAVLTLAVGLGGGGAVLAVVRSPLPMEAGVAVTTVATVLSLLGGLALLVVGDRRRRSVNPQAGQTA